MIKSPFFSSSHKEGYNIVGRSAKEVLDFFKGSKYNIRQIKEKSSKRLKNTIDIIVKNGIIVETRMN